MSKYPKTKFHRKIGQVTGNSIYEIWRVRGPQDMSLVGFISREGKKWQIDVATRYGQKIKQFVKFEDAKTVTRELLA